MNYDEALFTYIEVSVAFAGFAALVTAIRDHASGKTDPHLWVRLRGMVELALWASCDASPTNVRLCVVDLARARTRNARRPPAIR